MKSTTTTGLLVTLSSTGTTETIPGDRPAIGAAALRAMWGRTFRGEECPEEIHDVDPSGDSGIPAFLADVADRAVTLSTVAIGGQGYVLLPGEGVDGADCWALATITEAHATVGGWTRCGELTHGTVEALRDDDEVRISYTSDTDADDDADIRAAVEAALGVWIETPSGEWSTAEGDGEVVQTVALLDEQPTHEIVFTSARGEVTTTRVHLLDGVAYTRQELEAQESADWEVSDEGEWLCQGQATPGGANGTVEIRTL